MLSRAGIGAAAALAATLVAAPAAGAADRYRLTIDYRGSSVTERIPDGAPAGHALGGGIRSTTTVRIGLRTRGAVPLRRLGKRLVAVDAPVTGDFELVEEHAADLVAHPPPCTFRQRWSYAGPVSGRLRLYDREGLGALTAAPVPGVHASDPLQCAVPAGVPPEVGVTPAASTPAQATRGAAFVAGLPRIALGPRLGRRSFTVRARLAATTRTLRAGATTLRETAEATIVIRARRARG